MPVSRSDKERFRVFTDVKKAYGFRSSYVHGEDVKFEKLGTLYEEVRRCFANAIVRFQDLPQDLPKGIGAFGSNPWLGVPKLNFSRCSTSGFSLCHCRV
jgi:hypothetical protein